MSLRRCRLDKFTIIQDTREQVPLKFPENKHCNGTIVETVKHGDYSLKGLEDLVFCERKYSVGEWSKNSTEKRFKRLLDASINYKYRVIVCSFPYSDIVHFPKTLAVPPYVKRKIRISAEFLKTFTASIPIIYEVPIMFFDFQSMAEQFVFDWLRQIWKKECG